MCHGPVFAIAVSDEALTDRAGDLLPLVDSALDLDGCVLHGYRLHFSCGLNFKRHVLSKVVSARGHCFAQGVGAGQKMLDAMRFVGGGPSVNFGSVGTVEGEPSAIHFLFAGQIDFGDVDFGVVVRDIEVRFDRGCFLVGIRQLDGVRALVEQVSFGCLYLNNLIDGSSAPQRKMIRARKSPLVGCDGGDGFTVQGNNAAVGAHDIARGADIKNSAGKGVSVYGIVLNDLDASCCCVVVKRGDRDGR